MLTITEALAEIKTIGKRMEVKRAFILAHLQRPEQLRDPLTKDGGSAVAIARETQSIKDLGERIVAIRAAIAHANATTTITVEGQTKTIADWLTWRREVAPGLTALHAAIAQDIARARGEAQKRGWNVIGAAVAVSGDAPSTPTLVVNVDESDLGKTQETMQLTLGALDGQLSLKNATVTLNL